VNNQANLGHEFKVIIAIKRLNFQKYIDVEKIYRYN